MESIYCKNYLLTLPLLILLIPNCGQAHSPSPSSAPSPGSYSPSPTQSTSPSSSPSASESTSSSSSSSPTESTSPSYSPSAPESTPSSSSSSPTQSASPSYISAPESTPSSSSAAPTQSTSPSYISAPESTPSSSSDPPTQSTSPSYSPSAPESTPSSSSAAPQESTPPPSTQTQAPSMTPTAMMDSPDGEDTTTSSPTSSAPTMNTLTIMDSPDGEVLPESSSTDSAKTDGVSDMKISANVANNEAIKKICDHTDHPPLCMSSISPFFDGKTDVMQVLSMAINASKAQTEAGMKVLDKQASKPGTPPKLASALRDCKENFADALDNLEAAEDAIEANDIGTVQTMLSAALSDYVTCTDGMPGVNPLGMHTDELNNMASNCLAIAELHK